MTEKVDPERIRGYDRPQGLPFRITKIGHVVLNVTDLERSVKFYAEVLGFRISDVYPETMMPGGMVFLRCNPDHHGIALVGGMQQPSRSTELHHVGGHVRPAHEWKGAKSLAEAIRDPVRGQDTSLRDPNLLSED